MSEIPESVKEAARAAADAQGDYWKVGGTLGTIERAILVENERCAKIAENYTVTTHMHWDEDTPVTRKPREASEIAEMIRRR